MHNLLPLNPLEIQKATKEQLLDIEFIQALAENRKEPELNELVAERCKELNIYKDFNARLQKVILILAMPNNTDPLTYINVLNKIRELAPENNPKYKSFTDKAWAQLFSDVFKDYTRYNADAKEWFYYDGIKWQIDIGAMHTKQYMKMLADVLHEYAYDVDNIREPVSKLQGFKKRQSIIDDSRDNYAITMSMLDTQNYLFNCQNCVLNLENGQPLEHDPNLLLSKVANVEYNPNAKSPLFEKFLNEIFFDGIEKAEYLQKVFGYCLTGENTQEQYYMCYGSTTRNGKSTLVDTITNMFGDYAKATPPETFALRHRNSQNATPDLAMLKGARLIHIGETPKGMALDVALLKRFTGNDKISARNVYERQFEYYSNAKIVMNTNYFPVVSDDTLFASGRVKVVEFNRHFKPEEQDKRLKTKLSSKENMSAVLNWCLDGLAQYKSDNESLIPPKAVQSATEDYRTRSDRIGLFTSDCLVECDGSYIKLQDVYNEYAIWCKSNGYIGVENKATFKEKLIAKNMYAKQGYIPNKNGKKISYYNVVKGYKFANGHGPYEYV